MSVQDFNEKIFLIREGNKEVRCHCRMNFQEDPPEREVVLVLGETAGREVTIQDQELVHVLSVLSQARNFIEPETE